MFYIKKIAACLLAFSMAFSLASCKKDDNEDTIQSGELVVLTDTSEIGLGIYGIDTLNPLETKSESVQRIMNIIYEPLFTYDEKRNISGVLASGYTLSGDGMQITVALKNDVKWQDGTPFSADDVVYTLSKMRSSEGLYRKVADRIRSYTATDKYTVIINLERQETDFAYFLTFPIISKNSAYSKEDNFVPMGTGSYKFASRSGTEILLEPHIAWHGGTPSEKKITVKVLKDESGAADAFNVNEIDAVTSRELLATTPKMHSQTKVTVSDNMVFLGFNTQKPSLAPANIRRAVSVMIDKQKLVDNEAYGYGVCADVSVNPASWAYTALEKDKSEDLDEELISQEGYSMSEGVYYKDGLPLSANILVNSDNAQRTAIAQSICETLRASGFSSMVEAVSYEDYISRINSGDFDMFLGEITADASLNPAAMLTGDTNYFGFLADGLKSALSELYGVTDREQYKKGVKAFLNLFSADPPYLPLYFKTESVFYGSYVSGIENPSSFNAYKNIEKWYFYDKDGKEKDKAD